MSYQSYQLDARDQGCTPPTVVPVLTETQKVATAAAIKRLRFEFARHATGSELAKALRDMTQDEIVELWRVRQSDARIAGKANYTTLIDPATGAVVARA